VKGYRRSSSLTRAPSSPSSTRLARCRRGVGVTDAVAHMNRRLKAQFLYRSSRPSPQEQFLGMLVKAEREKLAAALALAGTNGLAETLLSDLILKVSLRGTKPLVWRRVRVVAALKPHFTFQDRVLGRWAGSATTHGFYFTDLADGS